jgi:RNA polymerase sigma-70 factor (ECF subfamily)
MTQSNNPPLVRTFQSDLIALVPFLRAFARTLCHGREFADDLAQNALAKAWAGQDRFEQGTNLKAWLFTILRNEFYSRGRRSWRQVHWDTDKAERIPTIADAQSWSSELNDTARSLRDLPDQQREALILIGAGGFSYEEAAKICGVPVGTMKSRVARGRTSLMDALEGDAPRERHVLNGTASEDILAQLSALTPAGAHRAALPARLGVFPAGPARLLQSRL